MASVKHLYTYSDTGNPRTLGVGINTVGPNTIESCTDACFNAGYPLAGAEFATQCFCGLDFAAGSGPTPLADCDMPCTGNSSEFCGGPNRLNVSDSGGKARWCTYSDLQVYNFTGTLPHGPTPVGGGGGGVPVFPVTSGLPTPWEYAACYV